MTLRKKHSRLKVILAILVPFAFLGLSLINVKTYTMTTISDFLKDQVDRHQTPSIQYALFDSDSILYTLSYGIQEESTGRPVDTSATYHLYSVTKTFTALAVLQLAQEGRIDLARPVSDYLPAFPYDHRITIDQLLSHTSGIPNPVPLRWIHTPEEHAVFDWRKFFEAEFSKHPKLNFEPGTRFQYSNLGYVLLGELIETVSGESYETYITQRIIHRSGVDAPDLSFTLDPETYTKGYHAYWSFTNAIFGFLIDKPKFMDAREGRWKPFKPFYIHGAPYGGLFGSMKGLIRYGQALMEDSAILLQDTQKQILFREKSVQDKPTGMSYAWFTGMLKGHPYITHAGGGGGYYVELRIYPDLHIGSVILYNRSGLKDERVLSRADSFFLTEKGYQGIQGTHRE